MPTEPEPAASGASLSRRERRERRERVRAALIDAAVAQGRERSFGDITVESLGRAAGISRSAFYNHFRDKEDLLLAALAEVEAEVAEAADGAWRAVGPPAARVRRAVAAFVGIYADRGDLLRTAAEASAHDEDVRAAWTSLLGRFVDSTAEHVRAEQAVGLIPDLLDPEATAEGLVWMAERLLSLHPAPGERSPDEAVDAIAGVWTAALYPGIIPADEFRPGPLGERAA